MDTLKNLIKSNPFLSLLISNAKARRQEAGVDAENRFYDGECARKGIKPLDDARLREALVERLERRNCVPVAKAKGDLHIFLAFYLNNWEAVLPGSLAHFGTVTQFEWGSRGFNERSANWLTERDAMNKALLDAFSRAHEKRPVDVVVGYLSGHTMDPGILSQITGKGTILVNFNWDDTVSFRGIMRGGRWTGPTALAPVVDLNLTSDPHACMKYMVEGGLAMFWPLGADPAVHKPCDVAFEFDVSFVGLKYGWRPHFIQRLRKMGIPVQCFGGGWENGPLSSDEMVRLYSRSRVNLGFAGIGDSRKVTHIKGRDFEVPMSGGLYITQDHPHLSRVYDTEREIVVYSDENDCAKKIRALLDNPGEAEKIRHAGQRRALKDHTWEQRFEQVFRIIGIL